MSKILIVVGTRPNFMKVTQFRKEAARLGGFDIKILHTGQHYDQKMSNVFFEQFGLVPDIFLNIAAASPNTQMAEVMLGLERESKIYKPDMILVVGDVNSTFAAALTANKMGIPCCHVESGLRSGDRGMPEEINRILTDEIADFLFVTEQSGVDNLKQEGKDPNKIFLVGNTMIDTMVAYEDDIQNSEILNKLGINAGEFLLMTMHRPATVDNKEGLRKLLDLVAEVTQKLTLVFPIHPRTVARMKSFGMYDELTSIERLILSEPMSYFNFQRLVKDCKLILTDSGGIQEEATFRGVPCLTLRPNTERPSTIDIGTNTLVGFNNQEVLGYVQHVMDGTYKKGEVPPLWDGKATGRILKILKEQL